MGIGELEYGALARRGGRVNNTTTHDYSYKILKQEPYYMILIINIYNNIILENALCSFIKKNSY